MSTVWPVLHYDDTEAALRFLVDVVGFAESVVVRDEVDDVVHAELAWPGGGTVLLGGTKHVGGAHSGLKAGALYLVTDDVDAVHDRLVAASADVVMAPHETSFAAGGPTRACSARDTEGNLLTFGTYRGGTPAKI
ncbi:VOC family protein [Actinomycetospora corticicola]|uniref:Putative glyoxalase superfamily protein PhnB n=1 Tax=Actinomycetospora corticicola TaxID=663602 RepID=A0A7Y9J8D9_9PSEU|nr:VOC family protein [Actinomycetospora corticicola]NYD39188.1 putative glyoxalase superfamily protein PhnB [Actinomycetospora corticicola]